jgi:hypothetical protein
MMRCTTLVVSIVAASFAGLAAQNPSLTAHPQETVQNGNGNLVAFGVNSTGSCSESHTMLLVPACELPTVPAWLGGIEVQPQVAAALTYASLTIRCGPANPATTALQSTFANNYAAQPTTALAATNLTMNWQPQTWVPIQFSTPYWHDGASALVLEIEKRVQPSASYPFVTMSTSSSPARTDRPAMIYQFGGAGSGMAQVANSAHAANPMLVRMSWWGTPTVRHRSDLGGFFGLQYALGGGIQVTMSGPAGHVYLLGAGLNYLPARLPIPGIRGALWISGPVGPVVFAIGVLNASGEVSHPVTIPINPSLVGLRLTYQGETIDPATLQITLTNGTDHFINP